VQGDLLAWLLAPALRHDAAHSHAVLARVRARHELQLDAMQLRERALALHLHYPHKFTLSGRHGGAVILTTDSRAVWAAAIARVQQVGRRARVLKGVHVHAGVSHGPCDVLHP
jgi:hypothetical protein